MSLEVIEVRDRFSRQAELVPLAKIQATPVTVVGAGAIGRQVALQLAPMGAQRVRLIDHDRVEHSNRTTQGYACEDVGELKVQALATEMRRVEPKIDVEELPGRWSPLSGLRPGSAVFVCVDNMLARKAVFEGWAGRAGFFCDGRLRRETGYVLTANDERARRRYAATLFDDEQAEGGRCTQPLTISSAAHAASLMLHQYRRWLCGAECSMVTFFSLSQTLAEAEPAWFLPEVEPAAGEPVVV